MKCKGLIIASIRACKETTLCWWSMHGVVFLESTMSASTKISNVHIL